MKKLSLLTVAAGFMGIYLTACSGYNANDYVNDMKNLSEEIIQNAADYTEEDWQRVEEEYKTINEKGQKILEDLTENQKRELELYAGKMTEKAVEFHHEELKDQFENVIDKADAFLDDLMNKINEKD